MQEYRIEAIQSFIEKSISNGEFCGSPSAPTVSLLRIIGSPFVPSTGQKDTEYSEELYLLACENKIPLAYLDRVASNEQMSVSKYAYYFNRVREKVNIIAEVSNLFERNNIDYAVLQMFEPRSGSADGINVLNLGLIFRDPDDIDIHIMGSTEEFHEAIRILSEAGYKWLDSAPYNQRLLDRHGRIELDVKNEFSISNLIYGDKHKIGYRIQNIYLPWGVKTKTFNAETHLLIILADSAIGKNSYRLADYLFTLHSFIGMDGQQIQKFVCLIKENYLRNAARWYLTLTLLLHMMAHQTMPDKIIEALSMIGAPCTEPCNVVKSRGSPYPYDVKTLLKIFAEKLRDDTFRQSILGQAPRSFNLTFAKRLLNRVRWLLGITRIYKA